MRSSLLAAFALPALALARGPNRLRSGVDHSAHARSHASRTSIDLDLAVSAAAVALDVNVSAEVDVDANLAILGLTNETRAEQCSAPAVRHEWRTLSDAQKEEYLAAVKCLANSTALTPPPDPVDGIRSLYDNFVATHIRHTDTVHYVGHFLPWHRYLVWAYEQALQQTCNYTGAQPYWDWTQDVTDYGAADAFSLSPVFDDVLGFGGNGSSTNATSGYEPFECVATGPFGVDAGWVANMGPGNSTAYEPRCLTRGFNTSRLDCGQQDHVDALMNQTSFWHFSATIDGRLDTLASNVHRAGHGGVGGDMQNVYSSPVDPLFFLHHANLDRLWTAWQAAAPAERTYDVSGNAVSDDWYGLRFGNVTLDYTVDWSELGPRKTLRELMSTTTGEFCYEYASAA